MREATVQRGALDGLEPGEQALFQADRLTAVLDALPDAAGENLFVVSVTGPSRVERAVTERGFEPRRVGVVPVTATDVSYDGPLWTAEPVSPSDLTGLSIEFGKGLRHVRPGVGWIVLDNLTTLLMYANEERLYRLLATLTNATRNRDARGVHSLVPNTLDDRTANRFRSLYDVELPG